MRKPCLERAGEINKKLSTGAALSLGYYESARKMAIKKILKKEGYSKDEIKEAIDFIFEE